MGPEKKKIVFSRTNHDEYPSVCFCMALTCGLLFGGYLQYGAVGPVTCLCERPDLEHIGRAGLQVVHGGRRGLGPHRGVNPVLLIL